MERETELGFAALFEKGRLLGQQGKNKQAASCLEQAGKALLMQGVEEKALSLWQMAVDLGAGEPLRQWVSLLERQTKSLPAEQVEALWLYLAKTYGDDCNDGYMLEYLADKLHKLQCYKQALSLHQKAYSLGRQSPQTCNMIALSLSCLMRDHEAIVWFRKGEGAPYNKEVAYWKGRAIQFSGQGSQREVNRLWDGWGRELLAGAPARPPMPPKPRPLRLGFRSHYLGGGGGFADSLMAHLAPALARRGVEVRLYVVQEDPPNPLPEIAGSKWVYLAKLDWPEKAKVIRDDQLHALIDLDWLPVNLHLEIYKYSPAPLVMSELHPFSSQAGAVDYLIADGWLYPPGAEEDFSEKIIRTKEPIRLPPPNMRAPPIAPPPCLTQGFITFGSVSRGFKLNQSTLAAWTEIIKQIPRSRLLLRVILSEEFERAHIKEILLNLDLPQERFEILTELGYQDYLASYSQIDIVLDPLDFNGGMTSLDALWQGTPVLTCPGHFIGSRQGAALLTAIGRPEWIARDLDHWQRMAVAAASDYERLRRWRFELRPQIAQSILCDAERRADVFLEAIAPVIDRRYAEGA